MNRYVRITAQAISPTEHYKQLHFDVLMDENGRVQGDDAIFGMQGLVNAPSSNSAPFILFDEGTLQYGDADKETAYAFLDVRSKPLLHDTRLEIIYNGLPQPYRVTRINEVMKSP